MGRGFPRAHFAWNIGGVTILGEPHVSSFNGSWTVLSEWPWFRAILISGHATRTRAMSGLGSRRCSAFRRLKSEPTNDLLQVRADQAHFRTAFRRFPARFLAASRPVPETIRRSPVLSCNVVAHLPSYLETKDRISPRIVTVSRRKSCMLF
jgi:hypothetical protein